MSQDPYSVRLDSMTSFLGDGGKLAKFGKEPADAFLLICQDGMGWEDVYYLTGFVGTSGVLLITGKGATLFVDPRYAEVARVSCRCAVVLCDDVRRLSPLQAALSCLLESKPRRVAYGGRRMRHSAYQYLDRFLRAAERRVEMMDLSSLLSNLRRHKSASEVDSIREAVNIASAAFNDTLSNVRAGMSEREFAARLDCLAKMGGGDFMDPLPVMVASGERTSLPHALPTEREFAWGDIVMVDFGVRSGGYVCDITRMFSLGEPSSDTKSVYSILRWAQTEASSLVKPGVLASAVDAAARDVAGSAGFGDYFTHGVGHGIGLCMHEPPSLNSSSRDVLADGDVLTLEPGFYKPGWGGMRLEDDYLVTKDGVLKISGCLSDELFVVS